MVQPRVEDISIPDLLGSKEMSMSLPSSPRPVYEQEIPTSLKSHFRNYYSSLAYPNSCGNDVSALKRILREALKRQWERQRR